MKRKTHEERTQDVAAILRNVMSGTMLAQALREAKISKGTYYKYHKYAKALLDQEPLPPASKITIHQVEAKMRPGPKPGFKRSPKEQSITPSAIFIGDADACAEFFRKFK